MEGTEAPQIFEHHQKNLSFTPFDVKWIPSSAKCVLVGQTPKMKGVIKFFQLEKDELKEIFTIDEIGSGFKTCSFNYNNSQTVPSLILGDITGRLFVFDLESQKIGMEIQAHKSMINALDTAGGLHSQGPIEILTGGRDGAVKLWDLRQKDPVLVLEPREKTETPPDCWSVALGNCHSKEDRVIAAGYDNGDVKLFDLRKNQLIWDHNLKNGVCGLQFDRKDIQMNKLGVTTLEGKCHIFDLRTQHPVHGFSGLVQASSGNATIWGLRHLPQNRDVFATLNGDGFLKLYRYRYPVQRCVEDADGHIKGVIGSVEMLNDKAIAQQPIVGYDWNADKIGLGVSCALDQTLKIIIVTKLNLY